MSMEDLEDDLERRHEFNAEREMFAPNPQYEDAVFDGGLSIPGEIWNDLFPYQKTCKNGDNYEREAR